MEEIVHILWHAFLDALKILPFLFLAYLLIEYVEHRASDKFSKNLAKFGRFSPVVGAALGMVPQCGFSVTAANLFSSRLITAGTFAAVFVATSDEALPLLFAAGDAGSAAKLIGVKFVIGAGIGILIDILYKGVRKQSPHDEHQHIHSHCGDDCCKHGIFRSAIIHTLKSFAFLFAAMVVLAFIVHFVGEQAIASVFLTGTVFQPVLATLVGFIPNCAPSILLTQLYLDGALSFGSLCAGLISNSGIALVALFRANKNIKQTIAFAALFFVTAIVFGWLIQLVL